MIEQLDDALNHLNDDHADTIALVGQYLSAEHLDASTACSARLDRVDAHGVDLIVLAAEQTEFAPVVVHHAFAEPCTSLDEFQAELFSLLSSARAWAGATHPITSLERERRGGDYTTFIAEVAAVADVTPSLRQITFGGGLDDYVSVGGDQFLYVLLPPPGESVLSVDSTFTWQQYEAMAPQDRPAGGYYSVRAWRESERELDMWFVLHGDGGGASAWARQATVGQPAALWGPRRIFEPPPGTGSYLFVIDETGFGAVAAVLDELLTADPSVRVTVIAECDASANRVVLPAGPNIDVTWVDRQGAPPGTTPLLVEAVQNVDLAPDVYAFGAAESRRITDVRAHLRHVRSLPAEQVSMTGYWRAS